MIPPSHGRYTECQFLPQFMGIGKYDYSSVYKLINAFILESCAAYIRYKRLWGMPFYLPSGAILNNPKSSCLFQP